MAIIYRLGETREFIERATGQGEKMENENYHKSSAADSKTSPVEYNFIRCR